MELKCKLGSGFTDVVAIELKNRDGSNKTSPEQDAYLERLRGCNVATLVSNSYHAVIIFLHEHYKSVNRSSHLLMVSSIFRTKSSGRCDILKKTPLLLTV